ncbi:MAG: hypothetical protein RL223_4088 [Pseudomonadota bacterium]|jgi:[acyl-carrier-protein] S-malonyltransferase
MTLALLFPGQGTQHPDLLPWLEHTPACAPVLAAMAARIGADWRAALTEPDRASDNRCAQPLLTGLSLACWAALAERLPTPGVIAGYSVGELAAASVAGLCDAATALALAEQRAERMSQAVAGRRTGLLAVQGPQAGCLQPVLDRHGLALAIRIAPDSAVIGGLTEALDAAQAELAAQGARLTRLAVRVASHTPWMAPAAVGFAEDLAAAGLAAPRLWLTCNADGVARRDRAGVLGGLAAQIAAPVRWDACMDSVAERGARCVLEVGPGRTLAKMWQARHPHIPARSVEEFGSPQAAADWVARTLG